MTQPEDTSKRPLPPTHPGPPPRLGAAVREGVGKPLEGRVSSLEVHMDHMASTVTTLGREMHSGFAETRRMFESSEQRATHRDSKLHARITEHQEAILKKGQWSWPLLIMTAAFLMTVGGVAVSFVNMNLAPIEQRTSDLAIDAEKRELHLDNYRDDSNVNFRDLYVQSARHDERLSAAIRRAETLNEYNIKSRNDLSDRIDSSRTEMLNRFTAKEGQDLQRRAQSLENRLVDLAASMRRQDAD